MEVGDRRKLKRIESHIEINMIGFTLFQRGIREDLVVINFNSQGACFKRKDRGIDPRSSDCYIFARVGLIELERELTFEIVWETLDLDGRFGVVFKHESKIILERSERFIVNNLVAPSYFSTDPLDVNRRLFFKVINISNTGMLLQSSLSNRHLVPGMRLQRGQIEFPNQGREKLDVFIENIRLNDDRLHIGVSYIEKTENYKKLISRHLLETTKFKDSINLELEEIKKIAPAPKQIKEAITIREISDDVEYEKVKALRYIGYKRAGKLKDTVQPSDMGPGLEQEGIVLGAYLGAKLVASADCRLSRYHELVIAKDIEKSKLNQRFGNNLYEINRLVVDPAMQRSDVVLALFQKIHTIALLNEFPTCLCYADDRLIGLYRRLGFAEAGYTKPHPVINGVKLNLLFIESSTYLKSIGMNSFAWANVYQDTADFLSEIGIGESFKFNLRQRFEYLFSKFAFKIVAKTRKKSSDSEPSKTANFLKEAQNEIDPKWTKQHINATVLIPYIKAAEDTIGDKVIEILNFYGFNRDYFEQETNWISIEFFDRFSEELVPYLDLYLLNRKAGRQLWTKDVLKSNYYLLRYVVDPKFALKQLSNALSRFNKTRELQVLPISSHSVRLRITNLGSGLLPKHSAARENWISTISGLFEVMFSRPPHIVSTASSWAGDPYCELIVTWNRRIFDTRNLIRSILLVLGVTSISYTVYLKFSVSALLTAPLLVSFVALMWLFSRYRIALDMRDELSSSFNEYVEKSDSRYKELINSKVKVEENLQEQNLQQKLMEKILVSADSVETLDLALTAICTDFGYKRAFIMLEEIRPSENQLPHLVPARVYGEDSYSNLIWKFRVPLQGLRGGGIFLSTVYYTGQSLMLNDIKNQTHLFGDDSVKLIESLKTKAFCIIAIPSKNKKSQGVLIADKGMEGDYIRKRDVESLERICQSIGLALDNQDRYSKEVALRATISKFVSPDLIEKLIHNAPEKVTYMTDITAMIFDVADSVNLSKVLPVDIYNSYINRLFVFLDEAIEPTGGVINKFLGDGGLVVWDEKITQRFVPSDILGAIFTFFEKVRIFNENEMVKQGLPALRIRIGLSRGQAHCGLVGSAKRSEWSYTGTCIGLAARYEQLNKLFDGSLAISNSITNFESLSDLWTVVRHVKVKQSDEPMDAAIFKFDFEGQFEPKKEVA